MPLPHERLRDVDGALEDDEPTPPIPLVALPARLLEESPTPEHDPRLASVRAVDPDAAERLQRRLRLASSELVDLLNGIGIEEPPDPLALPLSRRDLLTIQ